MIILKIEKKIKKFLNMWMKGNIDIDIIVVIIVNIKLIKKIINCIKIRKTGVRRSLIIIIIIIIDIIIDIYFLFCIIIELF